MKAEADKKEEEKEGEDKSQPRSIRDRRRPREKRRSTGVSFWSQDVRDLHSVQSFLFRAQFLKWSSHSLWSARFFDHLDGPKQHLTFISF